eukprot:9269807-Lingulodinium_polyedra.AAC.1
MWPRWRSSMCCWTFCGSIPFVLLLWFSTSCVLPISRAPIAYSPVGMRNRRVPPSPFMSR